MSARFAAIWLALALLAAPVAPAATPGVDLGRAKGSGVVGERADGYVGVVVPQTVSGIEALVRRVNSKRRAAYEAIAAKTGASVAVVEVLAGEKLIARASSGAWVTDADGVWHRK